MRLERLRITTSKGQKGKRIFHPTSITYPVLGLLSNRKGKINSFRTKSVRQGPKDRRGRRPLDPKGSYVKYFLAWFLMRIILNNKISYVKYFLARFLMRMVLKKILRMRITIVIKTQMRMILTIKIKTKTLRMILIIIKRLKDSGRILKPFGLSLTLFGSICACLCERCSGYAQRTGKKLKKDWSFLPVADYVLMELKRA